MITTSGAGNAGKMDLFRTYAVRIAAKNTGVMNIRYRPVIYALYIDGAFIDDYHTIAGVKRDNLPG